MVEVKTIQFDKPVVKGTIQVPGDKSISHRAIMLGSIASGKTTVTGFLEGEDCLRTIDIFKKLGVSIEQNGTDVLIESPGIQDWTTPVGELYAGNSGTTARLLLGILSGSSVNSVLTGDDSLSKRPMKRVTIPLQSMGASISGNDEGDYLPLSIKGESLKGIDYQMQVASAQVKSAILFAGLNAHGLTVVKEFAISRDHTERMFKQFGANIQQDGNVVSLQGGQVLKGTDVVVPGDISSAAFFMVAAAMVEGSTVEFVNVGLNPTRTGIIMVLEKMGAQVEVLERYGEKEEPYGTIRVSNSHLKGISIEGDIIPTLIDELPIIALLATQAEGITIIKDAEELRVKETDRIAAVTNELNKLGAQIEATDDGMIIKGPTPLKGAKLKSYGDHRLGMMAAIAALITEGPVEIENPSCIAISYPNFFEQLSDLIKKGEDE
ncbi:3-phosphoshikimate 1-carboxyvinyltransferase [Sporosarcina highlanderae]|uniref:3-phosphoshikimate 1-carboxyvinyltransferase n=1 Tax=Sporosarcina highlanderae TaxID=3035916 RepID=A0ABT8JUC0_9BACL|nr:3-phosphoshikimate 1-carboxyvinyltransferase [Sporosarcina highlanderae]MDN4608730.1 3-phosphoshikimate 1-carboxyvinyltransferase [Sporosarcina highlanderae]